MIADRSSSQCSMSSTSSPRYESPALESQESVSYVNNTSIVPSLPLRQASTLLALHPRRLPLLGSSLHVHRLREILPLAHCYAPATRPRRGNAVPRARPVPAQLVSARRGGHAHCIPLWIGGPLGRFWRFAGFCDLEDGWRGGYGGLEMVIPIYLFSYCW